MDERDKIFICEPVFALASSPMARKFLKKSITYEISFFSETERQKEIKAWCYRYAHVLGFWRRAETLRQKIEKNTSET